MGFDLGTMRKARRCGCVLSAFAGVCGIYFLLVMHGEHMTWAEFDLKTLTRNDHASGSGHECAAQVDPEFVASINNTAYGHPMLQKDKKIVYVSVPKCGSRTFVWIAWILKDINNISAILDTPYLLQDKSVQEMKPKITEMLSSVPPRSLTHGHLRFMYFPDPAERPVYISMLRDPLARHISWYYFMRFGDKDMDAKEVQADLKGVPSTINETYDECVQNGRADCNSPYYTNLNIRIFCGYEDKCIQSPQYALEQAKRNVDRFLFVGIVEEYEDTIAVMERLLPSMFNGALKNYKEKKDEFSSASKTSFKKEPQPETVRIMKERLKLDYEFYYYVRDRFHKLKAHLGVGTC